MQALSLFLLAVWLAFEINHMDMSAPPPEDPYRYDRWQKGEKSLEQ